LKENDIRLMAYCPMAQGGSLKRGLLADKNVKEVAARHNVTPMQILLAFAVNDENVFAIPRSSKAEHVAENLAAADIKLTEEDIYLLNKSFPAPTRKTYLDMV
ncbi:MAG: aldo/keto reductase, partial [Clostridiales bacterium]|nr:aldo/keto reductase [Clostridiales bacterium]